MAVQCTHQGCRRRTASATGLCYQHETVTSVRRAGRGNVIGLPPAAATATSPRRPVEIGEGESMLHRHDSGLAAECRERGFTPYYAGDLAAYVDDWSDVEVLVNDAGLGDLSYGPLRVARVEYASVLDGEVTYRLEDDDERELGDGEEVWVRGAEAVVVRPPTPIQRAARGKAIEDSGHSLDEWVVAYDTLVNDPMMEPEQRNDLIAELLSPLDRYGVQRITREHAERLSS